MLPDPADALHKAGLRVTQGRLAVLAALEQHPHSSAEAVYRAISGSQPVIPLQSVHNALNDLTRVGLIRRIEPAGLAALYELRTGDNHHHIVCRECRAIADVDCVTGHAPCLTPSTDSGFTLDMAEVTFWGLCPSCAAQPMPV